MNLGLQATFSREFDNTNKFKEFQTLDNEIENYFINKSYGKSINSYIIGIVCVSQGFDPFFKAQKPKYTEDKMVAYHNLSPVHIYKSLEFTIKLDYDIFHPSNTEEGLRYVAKEIMNTVLSIKYPKKVTDFDRVRFEQDLEMFFKEMSISEKNS